MKRVAAYAASEIRPAGVRMLPLEAVRLERFAVTGAIWFAAAVVWAALTVWMERDARSVFGRSLPWKTLFVAVGVAVFLGTYQLGQTALPFLVALLALAGVAYILVREAVDNLFI